MTVTPAADAAHVDPTIEGFRRMLLDLTTHNNLLNLSLKSQRTARLLRFVESDLQAVLSGLASGRQYKLSALPELPKEKQPALDHAAAIAALEQARSQAPLYQAAAQKPQVLTMDQALEKLQRCCEHGLGPVLSQPDATKEGLIESNKILVIVPYDVQINKLEERLTGRARACTVDRFQGQEAPICIYSLSASSGNKSPRGIDFLLAENRLNVAIRRAQCLVLITGSPSLMTKKVNKISEARQLSQLARISNQHQLTKWESHLTIGRS